MFNFRSLLTLMLTLISCTSIIAQDNQELYLAVEHSKDTTQVNALIDLGKALRRTNLDSAVYYFDLASEKAKSLHFTKGQIKAIMSKGIGYGMNNQYANAIQSFKQVAQIATANNDFDNIASAYNNLGIVYKRLGDYPTSYDYYNKSLEIELQDSMDKDLSYAYSNLGILHDLMKEYDKSYEFYQKALEEANRLGNDSSSIMTNIAIYFLRIEDYRSAIDIFRTSNGTPKDRYTYFSSASNLGFIYNEINQYDSAIYYSKLVIDSAKNFGGGDLVVNSYFNRARAHLAKSDLSNALADALSAVHESENFGFQLQHQSYQILARVYDEMGDLKRSNDALIQVIALQDSLFESDKIKSFKEEEVRQDIFEKKRQIEEQQANLVRFEIEADRDKFLKLFLISLAGGLVVLIGFLFQRYNLKNQMNQMLENKNVVISSQKVKIEEINEQLEGRMLRAQINPHFIFNALNSIQHFITQNDRKTALSYLTKFSSLLRQILENSISVMVPIADELKSLKIYLEIESLRFDGAFDFKIDVDDGVDINGQEVPILLLQPFTENAILHGLMPKEGPKMLTVKVRNEGDFIIYQIEDNGIGREAARKIKSTRSHAPSRGMSVTAQRIALLKSKNQTAEVMIEDKVDQEGKPCGTSVIIKIPISE